VIGTNLAIIRREALRPRRVHPGGTAGGADAICSAVAVVAVVAGVMRGQGAGQQSGGGDGKRVRCFERLPRR